MSYFTFNIKKNLDASACPFKGLHIREYMDTLLQNPRNTKKLKKLGI
jgi:hypothetical protein